MSMNPKGPADVPLGMMDGAYFTSRKEILDFFNNHLSMNLTKIEETATGAVACQLMDYMFPGSIPMKKVNWEAKSEFQYIENYKLLQVAFTKNRVQKDINVDRLIRAKYQDNLEFCQWLKAFFEHAAPASREDYDPVGRRQLGKGGKNLNRIFLPHGMKATNGRSGGGGDRGRTRSTSASGNRNSRDSISSTSRSAVHPLSSRPTSSACMRNYTVRSEARDSKNNDSTTVRRNNTRQSTLPKHSNTTDAVVSADAELLKKNTELKRRNAELELTLDNVENERDFYFDKLRGIEVMLQVHEEQGEESDPEALIQRIFKVLYAKQDDDLIVTDEGDLIENNNNDEGMNDTIESVITMEDLAE